ncbi:MAG TPA: prepilin-type N-terminal cleavage/methylation domain-containing protein [Thermodesulfovibrionales bacterium]|nr:prepilin-type N-terminal cleavage/methylation domain-containing protein [Thermodesulfovibrionales bacterium]
MKYQGFTLLELIIAIFIVSIVLALSLPSFTELDEGRMKSDARRLASVMRYLNDSAIATKDRFFLKVLFSDKLIEYNGPDGEKRERFSSLSDVETQSKGKISEGEVTVFFGPSGASESLQFDLRDDGKNVSVAFNAMSGRVRVVTNE